MVIFLWGNDPTILKKKVYESSYEDLSNVKLIFDGRKEELGRVLLLLQRMV